MARMVVTHTEPPTEWVPRSFSPGTKRLTTHLKLLSRLRMHGAITLLPCVSLSHQPQQLRLFLMCPGINSIQTEFIHAGKITLYSEKHKLSPYAVKGSNTIAAITLAFTHNYSYESCCNSFI